MFPKAVSCLFVIGAAASACASPPSTTSGCSKALPDGQEPGNVYNVTIPSGGDSDRYVLISIPPSYKAGTKTSAILSFHGGRKTAEDQLDLDLLTSTTFNSDKFVIYPQGIDNLWQGVPGVDVDDVAFTTAILDHLQDTYCIDSSRIFATGKSDGAGFVNVLACDANLSARIAAFAPVSGAFYINTSPCHASTVTIPCSASRKDIPFLEFHGGNDTTIAYTGGARKGECLPTIPHFIQQWAVRDGLGSKNTSSPLAENTTRYKFGDGLVQHIFDSVIGHDWPSTQPNDDNQRSGHHVASFNATPIILDFFNSHPLA